MSLPAAFIFRFAIAVVSLSGGLFLAFFMPPEARSRLFRPLVWVACAIGFSALLLVGYCWVAGGTDGAMSLALAVRTTVVSLVQSIPNPFESLRGVV